MWCAIFVKGTITNQQYLQQLQNEVILVIQRVQYVDTVFCQQDGACPHKMKVILDLIYDMFESCALGVGGPGHHVHCT